MTDGGTPRTTVRRLAERGAYDRETIDAIIDDALICHVGFDDGEGPMVIPTIHARIGDTLYLHGSAASRMLRTIAKGAQLCVTVTHLDGIVLAKSHFHSSMNYRSAVVIGSGRLVADADEKNLAFAAIVNKMQANRWDEGRKPTDKEQRATLVVAVPIDEASAKIRTGPPKDDDEDLALEYWAGVIPISQQRGVPEEHITDPL